MKWILTLCTYSALFILQAQTQLNQKIFLAEGVFKSAIDPLEQIYYINKNKQLIKISNLQDRKYVYSDLMIDHSTTVNVQNPFKTALYKKDVGDLMILDSRLTLTSKTNLFDLGYFAVTAFTLALDNKCLWIFDEDRQQIIKLDQQFKEIYTSANLSQILSSKIRPIEILEKENLLYLLDTVQGVFIFDNVGNYVKNYPIAHAEKIWLINGELYFYRQGQIWKYDTLLFEEIPQYQTIDYHSVSFCRDFILGINTQGQLYKLLWN